MKIGKSKSKAQVTAGSIRVAQGTYQKALLKKLFTQLLIALFALILVYFCFAATIVRFVPSSSGMVLTKNNTYPGGDLPKNSQILISLNAEVPVEKSMTGRLKMAVVPQKPTAIVSVQAGPIGKVRWTGGVLSVNGKALPTTFPEDPAIEYLNNQYIAVCIQGDCTPGTPIIFEPKQTIGVLLGQNREVPVAPPVNNLGPDRNNPEQVVAGYLVESYNGNTDLSCSLLSPKALKDSGGVSGCKDEARLLATKLGRAFDFGTGMVTKLTQGADANTARVDFTLLRDGEELSSGSATLVKGKQGWAIDVLTEK